MDVAIQRQLNQCTLEELIQIAIHLIFEIQYRLALLEQSESGSDISDSDDELWVWISCRCVGNLGSRALKFRVWWFSLHSCSCKVQDWFINEFTQACPITGSNPSTEEGSLRTAAISAFGNSKVSSIVFISGCKAFAIFISNSSSSGVANFFKNASVFIAEWYSQQRQYHALSVSCTKREFNGCYGFDADEVSISVCTADETIFALHTAHRSIV